MLATSFLYYRPFIISLFFFMSFSTGLSFYRPLTTSPIYLMGSDTGLSITSLLLSIFSTSSAFLSAFLATALLLLAYSVSWGRLLAFPYYWPLFIIIALTVSWVFLPGHFAIGFLLLAFLLFRPCHRLFCNLDSATSRFLLSTPYYESIFVT